MGIILQLSKKGLGTGFNLFINLLFIIMKSSYCNWLSWRRRGGVFKSSGFWMFVSTLSLLPWIVIYQLGKSHNGIDLAPFGIALSIFFIAIAVFALWHAQFRGSVSLFDICWYRRRGGYS